MTTRMDFLNGGETGLALVDAIAAALLISVAAASAAGLSVRSARDIADARLQTTAAAAATQKMEQLLSLAWAVDPASPGATIEDHAADLTAEPLAGGGAGLSVGGSIDAATPTHVDYLDVAGRWLGGGSPPAGAIFERRWRIAPVAAAPAGAILIQVFVTMAASPALPASGAAHGGHVLLSTVRSRKAFVP
jgi:hypothetical protein